MGMRKCKKKGVLSLFILLGDPYLLLHRGLCCSQHSCIVAWLRSTSALIEAEGSKQRIITQTSEMCCAAEDYD